MNLFTKTTQKTDIKKIEQLRNWAYQTLNINREIPISISTLRCHEPGCPPEETIIVVMTNPLQQYKIHKSISKITEADIEQLLDR